MFVWGLEQFSIFINDLEDGNEYTPSNSTDDTKLCGVTDTLEAKTKIQKDLNTLGKMVRNKKDETQ